VVSFGLVGEEGCGSLVVGVIANKAVGSRDILPIVGKYHHASVTMERNN